MSYNCPNCQRPLYNRRLTQCGFCGAPIPENLRFTPDEISALNQQEAEAEAQHKQRIMNTETDEAKRRDSSGDFISLS